MRTSLRRCFFFFFWQKCYDFDFIAQDIRIVFNSHQFSDDNCIVFIVWKPLETELQVFIFTLWMDSFISSLKWYKKQNKTPLLFFRGFPVKLSESRLCTNSQSLIVVCLSYISDEGYIWILFLTKLTHSVCNTGNRGRQCRALFKGKKRKENPAGLHKTWPLITIDTFHSICGTTGAGNKTSLPAGVTACPQNSSEHGLSGSFSRLEELSTNRRSTKLYPLEEKLATIQKGIADWEVVKPVEPVQKATPDFTGRKILRKSIRTNRTSMNAWCSWN